MLILMFIIFVDLIWFCVNFYDVCLFFNIFLINFENIVEILRMFIIDVVIRIGLNYKN